MWFSGFFPLILSVIVEVYLWWILQASHLFKWEHLHNFGLTKYVFAPLYVLYWRKSSSIAQLKYNYTFRCRNLFIVTPPERQETTLGFSYPHSFQIRVLTGRSGYTVPVGSHYRELRHSLSSLPYCHGCQHALCLWWWQIEHSGVLPEGNIRYLSLPVTLRLHVICHLGLH